ncbi:MAG: S41 family peptidase [Myxococcota bacterium]
MYDRAVDLINERYLKIDEFDAENSLLLAAEAVEDAIPWLVVEPAGEDISLRHGQRGEFALFEPALDESEDLVIELERLEQTIRSSPYPIPDDVDLGVELLRGVSRALDRHSVVMYRGRLQRFDERIKGRLTGVGSRIGMDDGILTVREIFPDGPAEKGGLKAGDAILRIDGFSTVGLSTNQSVERIRGPEGSTVVLSVLRGEQEMDLTFTRAVVRIPNVTWHRQPSGVGIISIETFSEQTNRGLRQALSDFKEAGPLNGLIIDLRGNTGGSMIQACRSVDLFLTEGTVLRTEGRNGAEVRNLLRRFPARVDGDEPEVPMIILVDDRSASASEILAGALMLQDRAVLIGERTHGKGTVQMRHNLRPGDRETRVEMKMTVAEYKLTADRVSIQAGVGLEPDLWVLPAYFSRSGVWLPDALEDRRNNPGVIYVDERAGWRDGEGISRDTYLEEVAERVLTAMPASAGWGRADVLAAIEDVRPALAREEEALIRKTFSFRGIDWQPAPAPLIAPPRVDVEVTVVDPPVAGEKVEVRAEIWNRGTAPLYRSRIQLTADSGRLPWDNVTLPVGFIPPGASAIGSVMVTLPTDSPTRVDAVTPRIYGDGFSSVALQPVRLRIDGREDPPLAATARISRNSDGQRQVVLDVENLGPEPLSGLRARLALPEDTGVELLAREAALPDLAPGAKGQTAITAVFPDKLPDTQALELRVNAEGRGEVLRLPVSVPLSGEPVRVEPPRVTATLPVEAPVGPHDVTIMATDDQGLESVTVWWDNDKIAWREGGAIRHRLQLPITIEADHHVLTVKVVDDQGATTYASFHVQGGVDGGAADALPE